MRIIDADVMRDEWLYESGTFEPNDVLDSIDCQPTVDAVPVEWIESYVRDARATGDFSDEMCAVAIEAMLNDYRAGGERKHE